MWTRHRFGLALFLLAVAAPAFAQDEIFESDVTGGSKVNVFSRTASGDAAPIRTITSPFLNFPGELRLDKLHGEIVIADQGPSVIVFPRGANGSVSPTRFIFGSETLLRDPLGLDLDLAANEIYVSDLAGAIRVFARTADGNVPPIRSIHGPTTGLSGPTGVRVDRLHGELAVLTSAGVSFYPLGASGDQAPLRTIADAAANSIELDAVHDEVFVSHPSSASVVVYSRTDGTVLRTIVGPSTGFNPSCGHTKLSLDLYNNELVASTCDAASHGTLLVFSRTANGDVPPLRSISGGTTAMTFPFGLAIGKAEVVPQIAVVDQISFGSSNGNSVLEPGETVIFRSGWLNETSSAVALQSTLSNFTGPGTAAYGIPSPFSDFGLIAPGTIAGCGAGPPPFPLGCPFISLSVPASRPSQHWDASVWETPSTQNTVAVWHIHIGNSFGDVAPTAGQYKFIETIFHNSVTGGCGGGNYCPADPTTRAQVAVFLLLSKDGSSYVPAPATGSLFADVPASNGFAKWIEELAHRGVTAGCGGGNYCPDSTVTRAQMAVFLLLTKEGSAYSPPPAVGLFGDVPASNGFAKWIEELANRGISAGCGSGNYCPENPVTRGQMAVFLTTTFALDLNGL